MLKSEDCSIPDKERQVLVAMICRLDGQMRREKLFTTIKDILVMSDPQYWANNNEIANELAVEATQDFINMHCSIIERIEEDGINYLFVDPMGSDGSIAAPQAAGIVFVVANDEGSMDKDEEGCMVADECLTRAEQDLIVAMIAQWERGMPKRVLFDIVKRFIVMPNPQYYLESNDAANELAAEATQDFIKTHPDILERVKDGRAYLFVNPESVKGSPAAHQAARIAREADMEAAALY